MDSQYPVARLLELEDNVEFLLARLQATESLADRAFARIPDPDDLDYVLTLALGASNLTRGELDTIARVRSTLLEE